MTTHFIDIRAIPDPETRPEHVLGILYERLHLQLASTRSDSIGASFPGHTLHPRSLGHVLRLHGHEDALLALMGTPWLGSVSDHVKVDAISPAPEGAPHRIVRRQQFKTSTDRLRRRRMRRKGETEQQAIAAIPDDVQRSPTLPFIRLRSRSTGQAFCLFIAIDPPLPTPSTGRFNSYGLGPGASVPWF